ncbi:MAG: DUF438 domain-containing protein [Saccharofermentanales bacterium]
MEKKLDLSRSVYELVTEYPELADILYNLGLKDIKNPNMFHSVAKLMTIPKGAKMRGIPMEKVIFALMSNGFTLEGNMPSNVVKEETKPEEKKEEPLSRTEQLKNYLRRLSKGESLESVRADFVSRFSDVEAYEIMEAEQELMEEGVPLNEVQQLCDIHSALFHGATREEQIANAEEEVMASQQRAWMKQMQEEEEAAEEKKDPKEIKGHPLSTFTKENIVLASLIEDAFKRLDAHQELGELFPQIRELSIHYAKKGDLLYPLLKTRYDITGPSEVMWTVDDEIRDELNQLAKIEDQDTSYEARLRAVLKRAQEMIYKEDNILFPICAENFTEEEWFTIYQDSKDYPVCFGVEKEVWDKAEANKVAKATDIKEGEVVLPSGHMTVAQLTAVLNTIPLEISFVDDKNINRYFNEGHKVFKRPSMALDREVFTCHPPKIEPMVREILDSFRSGEKDSVDVWMNKNGRTYLVRYMAVRDKQKNYLGALEVVQDMEFAREHFAK